MKKIAFIVLVLLTWCLSPVASAQSQITIPGTQVTFRLNNEDWRFLRTFALKEGGDIHLYCYVGEVITDSQGDTILPQLRIYVVKNYDGDLYEFVYDRYERQPYQSLWEFSSGGGLPASGGLGYIGAYTNPSDDKDYQFYMTYFKDKKTFVEFRLETTQDTFEQMDFEFTDILGSIK
ncbi:MAG: hypothetical protein J6X59_07255 [Bacteroidales bacterium]|nr:hypothetical protein [Bacteroidales bacterium]